MSDKRLTTDPAGVQKTAVQPASVALAMLARSFTLAIAVVAGLSAAPRSAAADEAAVAFIRDLGNQSLAVIRSDTPLSSKAAYFERMIHQDFDLTGISRFVLGSYWRIASPAERRSSPIFLRITSCASMGDGSRSPATGVSS